MMPFAHAECLPSSRTPRDRSQILSKGLDQCRLPDATDLSRILLPPVARSVPRLSQCPHGRSFLESHDQPEPGQPMNLRYIGHCHWYRPAIPLLWWKYLTEATAE